MSMFLSPKSQDAIKKAAKEKKKAQEAAEADKTADADTPAAEAKTEE